VLALYTGKKPEALGVVVVFLRRNDFEVRCQAVALVAVLVIDVISFRNATNECRSDQSVYQTMFDLSVLPQIDPTITVVPLEWFEQPIKPQTSDLTFIGDLIKP